MPRVHCEEFAGFVFVNLAEDPVPLRTFLGDRLLEVEEYPFELMTQRYGFRSRIRGNWKLAVDSVCEWYHPPYVPPASSTRTSARRRSWCRPWTRTTTTCSPRTC
ncbi:Ring hydroxylating alpha subunit (catalytic domain) [Streptomyces sp. yr375]|nr:Ring hydroxylating alpha subunit (catalytic domain) [Streptomyces sp. yr375]